MIINNGFTHLETILIFTIPFLIFLLCFFLWYLYNFKTGGLEALSRKFSNGKIELDRNSQKIRISRNYKNKHEIYSWSQKDWEVDSGIIYDIFYASCLILKGRGGTKKLWQIIPKLRDYSTNSPLCNPSLSEEERWKFLIGSYSQPIRYHSGADIRWDHKSLNIWNGYSNYKKNFYLEFKIEDLKQNPAKVFDLIESLILMVTNIRKFYQKFEKERNDFLKESIIQREQFLKEFAR